MSIEIKKTGKNTYYRKDSNKMGGRKERQEVFNISLKYWERDMTISHRASSKLTSGWSLFDRMLSGGLKKSEIAMIGAICGAFPEDNFKSNVSSGIVKTATDRGRVVMIGMEHEFDHTDRLTEEFKNHMESIPYYNPISLAYVNGVPYNPMDEFDRPEFYKDRKFVIDKPDSVYLKNSEEVLSEQFKIKVNDTQQKIVTDTINSFVNVNEPYNLTIDNEGRQLYPETMVGINGITVTNNDLNKPELDTIDIFKDKDSLNNYLNYYHCTEININSLVKVINNILAKDNKEVLVIDKKDDKIYFLKIDARYKSVIVDKDRFRINPVSAINTEAYTTIQESLLKLLESIKGNEEFLLTYKIENDKGCEAFIVKKEWYMKKSKITLVIPDWMIEPKDVYEYMNSTGISEEEKEDTLNKRLNTLLEGTDYNWLIEEKMVPDAERTILYNTRLVRGNFVTCVNELDNNYFSTKIEALAECYYFLRKNVLKTIKDNIGRGSSKPYIFMDVTIEELIEDITSLLPENRYPSIKSKIASPVNECDEVAHLHYVACIIDNDGKIVEEESNGYSTRAEALSMLYTRLRLEKENNESKKN